MAGLPVSGEALSISLADGRGSEPGASPQASTEYIVTFSKAISTPSTNCGISAKPVLGYFGWFVYLMSLSRSCSSPGYEPGRDASLNWPFSLLSCRLQRAFHHKDIDKPA